MKAQYKQRKEIMPSRYKRNESTRRNAAIQNDFYQQRENEEEITIDLAEVWSLFKKHIVLIVLLTLLCGAGAGIGTKLFVPKTYASSASIFLTPMVSDTGYVDYNSMTSNEKLVNNVITLMTQNNIMTQVAKETGLSSAKEVRDALTVSNTSNTTLVTVTAVTEDARLSKNIVSSTVNNFIERMKDTLNVSNIEIVDNPKLSFVPVGPHVKRNALIGAVAGFMLGCAYIMIRVIGDKRLKNREEAEKYLGIPVLAQLPDFNE